MANVRPGPQAHQHGAADGHPRPRLATSTSSRSKTSTRCGIGATACSTRWSRRRATWRPPSASRIKVMSNLDIAERRLPQDGRIELNVGGNPVDMRVSVLPTMFGESVVIRVLDRTVVGLDLDKIGMAAGHARRVPRADPQAQRHRPGHRADRLRQDDHALLGPQRTERHRPTRSSPPKTRSSTKSTASSSARSTTRST